MRKKSYFEVLRDVTDGMLPHFFSISLDGKIRNYMNKSLSPVIGMELCSEDIGKTDIVGYISRWHFSEEAKIELIGLYRATMEEMTDFFTKHTDSVPSKGYPGDIHIHIQAARLGDNIVTDVYDETIVTHRRRLADELFENVLHELKNSMVPIGAFSGRLEEKGDEELSRDARIVKTEIRRLEHYYRNLATLHKMGEGVEIQKKECDLLDDIVKPALEIVEPRFEEKGIKIDYEHSVPKGFKILTEPGLMQTFYVNLSYNALEHGEGRVTCGVNTDYSPTHILGNFYNEGNPLSPEFIEIMFDRFVKKGKRGMGLGLHICKQAINLLGGDIWVERGREEGVNILFTHPKYIPKD